MTAGAPRGSGASLEPVGWRHTGAVAVVLALALVPGFPLATMANFGGYDEWLILSLTSQGIVSFPYANRPLALVWALPGVLGLPSTLAGYLAAHVGYLLATGVMVFGVVRNLARGDGGVALLAAATATVWLPLDTHRLNPLNNVMYSGATCAAVLALLLFVEWALRRGVLVLLVGVLFALLASRSYEGTLGLLALGAPVLLIPIARELRRPLWLTLLAWEGPMLGLVALAALPLLGASIGTYQTSGLGLDVSVSGVLGRLVQQLGWHVGPLVASPPTELASGRVAIATLSFAVGGVLLLGRERWRPDRARLGCLVVTGLGLAAAGLGPMLLTASIGWPVRMQGFSAPGVGLALGASVALVASVVGRGWRVPVAVVLGSWVVAAGTARTLALQRDWVERDTFWPAQSRLLRQLVDLAPDLKPSTLVVLFDSDRAFGATFPFRHAVKYLYEGRALGVLPEGHDFLYPTRFEERGVVSEPFPSIRRPWSEPVTRHGYDEVVVLRHTGGRLTVVEEWPSPGGPDSVAADRYAPRSRFVPGPSPDRGRILGDGT